MSCIWPIKIKVMMPIFAVLLLVLIISIVAVDDLSITIQWNNPTQFEGGHPLMASEIDAFHISWINTKKSNSGHAVILGNKNKFIITDLSPGNYVVSMRLKTVYGTMSDSIKTVKNLE